MIRRISSTLCERSSWKTPVTGLSSGSSSSCGRPPSSITKYSKLGMKLS